MTEFKGTPVGDDETLFDIATEALGAMVLAKARETAIARLSETLNRDEAKQRALPELLALAESVAANGLHADTLKACGCTNCTQIQNARTLVARIKGEMT